MKTSLIATLAAATFALPAMAQDAGDAAKGEKEFNKCKACHMIQAPDGTDVVKGGKTGPNLYGVIGRVVGSAPDFKYGEGLLEVNAKGTVWDEAEIAIYLADPTAWVEAKSGDGAAKSKMSFKLPKAEDAANMAAYLASIK